MITITKELYMFENDVKILTEKSVVSEMSFGKLFPDIYKRVVDYAKQFNISDWREMKYLYMNQIKERPVCVICGKPVKFRSVNKGYTNTCSRECDLQLKSQSHKKLWSNYTEEEKQARLDHAASVVEEKTGYRTPFANPEIRKKVDETMLERYGTTRYISEEGIQRMVKAHQDKREEIDAKIINTWSEKTEEEKQAINSKRDDTCIERFGTENYSKTDMFRKFMSIKAKEQWHSREFQEKYTNTMKKRYGVVWGWLTDQAIKNNGKTISKQNKEFGYALEKVNIHNYELEFRLSRYSYDLRLDQKNILIEIDPSYTHNSTTGPYFHGKHLPAKDRTYHLNKSTFAKDNGYRCIHIWDWDSWDKIIYLLTDKENIKDVYFDLKTVDFTTAKEFLEYFDVEGDCEDYEICLGLYERDTLAQLAVFKQLSDCKYELLRLCTRPDCNILGGSKRLFTHFIEQYNPIQIIAKSDNSKYDGSKYTELNMKFLTTSDPRKHWYNIKSGEHYLDTEQTNHEIMLREGFVEVYDCGQSTYIWQKA